MSDLLIDEFGNRIGLCLFDEVIETRNEELKQKEIEESRTENKEDNIVQFPNKQDIQQLELKQVEQALKPKTKLPEEQRKLDYELPLCSYPYILASNEVDYKFLSILTLFSQYGGELDTEGSRFIYKADNNGISLSSKLQKDYNISNRMYFNRNIKDLLKGYKTDTGIKLIEDVNGEANPYYRLCYSVDNKYYVTIDNRILKQLIEYQLPEHHISNEYTIKSDKKVKKKTLMERHVTNDTLIRLYVLFKFILREGARSDLSRSYLCKCIGLVSKTTKEPTKTHMEKLTANIKILVELGLISVYHNTELIELNADTKKWTTKNTYILRKIPQEQK